MGWPKCRVGEITDSLSGSQSTSALVYSGMVVQERIIRVLLVSTASPQDVVVGMGVPRHQSKVCGTAGVADGDCGGCAASSEGRSRAASTIDDRMAALSGAGGRGCSLIIGPSRTNGNCLSHAEDAEDTEDA